LLDDPVDRDDATAQIGLGALREQALLQRRDHAIAQAEDEGCRREAPALTATLAANAIASGPRYELLSLEYAW